MKIAMYPGCEADSLYYNTFAPYTLLNRTASHHTEVCCVHPPGSRWLETHIWHAKRMYMKDMWGFKIPFKSNR